MPLYEYQCGDCTNKFDVFRVMGRAGKTEACPSCGGKSIRKFSPVSFSFGWRLKDKCHERFGPKDEFEKDV